MFYSFKQRLLLGVFLFLIISIPIGAYLASQYQSVKSKADETPLNTIAQTTPVPTISPLRELLNLSELAAQSNPVTTPTPETESIPATSFGPTLSLKISLEGRNADQSTRLFVGIMAGDISTSPKFLLSFTIDVPVSGEYANLSLAGLTTGSKYTALLKGQAQIATSSAFYMSPNVTNLNDNTPLAMLSGDLNDDNQVSDTDYEIALKALGSTAVSSNWNPNADFNRDGVINTLDLVILTKNIGKIGASGVWSSPTPTATPSASFSSDSPVGGPPGSAQGHWIWVPNY